MAIARRRVTPGPDEPKLWFASIESLARVLSNENRALIDLIIETRPKSLAELEASSGRAKSNLSRTLKDRGALRPRPPRSRVQSESA